MLFSSHPTQWTMIHTTSLSRLQWVRITFLKLDQYLLSWSGFHLFNIDTKFNRNSFFIFEGEHDSCFYIWWLFKSRFYIWGWKYFFHLLLKKLLQSRVIFANEVDVFTFLVDSFICVVGFSIVNFFYICGCGLFMYRFLMNDYSNSVYILQISQVHS